MSWSINLFVRGTIVLADLASEIGRIVGVTFQVRHEGEETWYEGYRTSVFVTIGSHELCDDRDLHFSAFPWQVEFSPRSGFDPDGRKRDCLNLARQVFEVLQQREGVDLLLVENLQVQLAVTSNKAEAGIQL